MTDDASFNESHQYVRIVCIHCGHAVDVPVYCGNRFCNICSSPRKKRVRSRISFLIKKRPLIRGTMIKHLTLTVRNDDNLEKMFKHLIKSFRRLRQRAYFKKSITGGAFVVELTHKGNKWHAHIHAVIQAYRVEWIRLLEEWKICSKGSTGVYIKNIPPVQAVRYLTKYVTKSELPEDLQIIASDLLKHYRLFNPFGSWHDINNQYEPEPTYCSKCKSPASYLPWEIVMGVWQPRGKYG